MVFTKENVEKSALSKGCEFTSQQPSKRGVLREEYQLACKPGSVRLRPRPERGSHSSGTTLARRLMQPTRMTGPETGWSACARRVIPIRFCSRWGLPCRRCHQRRGGLLPHPFTLTRSEPGGLLSVALSLRSPSPDVIRHRMSMEPGLSSPATFRSLPERPSSRLTR